MQQKSVSFLEKFKDHRTIAILAIIICTVLWGLSFISSKSLLNAGLTPIQINSARFSTATIVFLLLYISRYFIRRIKTGYGSMSLHPTSLGVKDIRKSLIKMGLAALMGIPIYFLLETTGLSFTSAGTASLITGLSPIINAIALFIFLKVRIASTQWLGIIISCFGVYVVAQADVSFAVSHTVMFGNCLVFLSACSWVTYTIINKPLTLKHDNLSLNTFQYLIGTFILLVIAFLKEGNPFPGWNLKIWLNIIYLGVFCSALAFFLYLFALKRLNSTIITSFINLVPFVSVAGAGILLKEPIPLAKLLGGLLTIIGVYIVSSHNPQSVSRSHTLDEIS